MRLDTNEEMLEARNLCKSYKHGEDKLRVLKGVDLKVEKGEFVVMLGPSGAGKTTLIHLLGGLDCPSDGEVFLDGREIYTLSDRELSDLRNRRIGFIFQFYYLLSEFNALENVLIPGLMRKKKRTVRQEAQRILELVGLKNRMRHFPNQLSGGEQQRLAIARALINQPDLLFCDEPTGNLDSVTGRGIIELIRQLNHIQQMTVILVTHNKELANSTDRIFHLNDGILIDGFSHMNTNE